MSAKEYRLLTSCKTIYYLSIGIFVEIVKHINNFSTISRRGTIEMSVEDTLKWTLEILKEIQKHAEKDSCYSCKQLLKTPQFQALQFLKQEIEK